MADRKSLKKDIKNIAAIIIEDCYNFQLDFPGKKEKESNAIIDKAVALHDELITKVNKYREIEPKKRKAYFNGIKDELESRGSDFLIEAQKLN